MIIVIVCQASLIINIHFNNNADIIHACILKFCKSYINKQLYNQIKPMCLMFMITHAIHN